MSTTRPNPRAARTGRDDRRRSRATARVPGRSPGSVACPRSGRAPRRATGPRRQRRRAGDAGRSRTSRCRARSRGPAGLGAQLAGDLAAPGGTAQRGSASRVVTLGLLPGRVGLVRTRHVLSTLGFVAEQLGDPATAVAAHTEALAEARRVDDAKAAAAALVGLAGAAVAAGDLDTGRQRLEEALSLRQTVAGPPTAVERFDLERIAAALAIHDRD